MRQKTKCSLEFAARRADVRRPFEAAGPGSTGLPEYCRFLNALSCSSTACTTMTLLCIALAAMKLRPLSPGHLRRAPNEDCLSPSGIRSEWLPPGFLFQRDTELSYDEIDRSEGVLTGCAGAIALTGTIVLRHSESEGRRALTLIPDYHLCVVYEQQVVETVPEAIEQMSAYARSPITTVRGPRPPPISR